MATPDNEALAAMLTAEQERIVSDLHDTAGQLFAVLGLMLRREGEGLSPDAELRGRLDRLAELADRGRWEIEQGVRGVAFLPTVRHGLVEALTERAAEIEADSGLKVTVTVTGDAAGLPVAFVRALYRVANEALVNVWRHAAASGVAVELTCEPETLVLRVQDDGRGAPADGKRSDGERTGAERRVGGGTAGMHRAVRELGGSLHVGHPPGGGMLVAAHVPRPTVHENVVELRSGSLALAVGRGRGAAVRASGRTWNSCVMREGFVP